MGKKWICLFVENEIGTLARIAGLFSGKLYNLESLTVGTTEDKTISRMTISLASDDKTFEQVIKQFNKMVEVIKVIDYTNIAIYTKELMFIKVIKCSEEDIEEISRISSIFDIKLIDANITTVLIESLQTEKRNTDLINLLKNSYPNRIEITRGGSVAVETVSI